MCADLRFEVLAWLSSEVGNEAERASYGDLAIRAGDVSLSFVIDNLARSPHHSIHVSLNHLARWFADSWWRLRARHLREQWGLGDGPVSDERLSEILQGDIHSKAAWIAAGDFSLGFRENGALRPAFRAFKRRESRRFAVARMLADAAFADQDGDVLPLTESRTARQKLQRAAAQELLCPVEAIKARLDGPDPDDEKLFEIADEFGVSDFVVRTALVNNQILPRRYLPAA